jgi:hypothetical protein
MLFLVSALLLIGGCSGEKVESDPQKVEAIMNYSKAVQSQSSAWSALNNVWEKLSEEKTPEDFRTTLSLHGIKKLRNYIDGIDRISSKIPELKQAHQDLVSAYRFLEVELLAFLERTQKNFDVDPEEVRESSRKELKAIFSRTRAKESRYLERVRYIYQTYNMRLKSNTSNRYENPEAALEDAPPKEEAGE